MAQDWFDVNAPESPQRGPGATTTQTPGPWASGYVPFYPDPDPNTPGNQNPDMPQVPTAPSFSSTGPADGDYQKWFQTLVGGRPSSYALIKQLEPQLTAAGIQISTNKEGDPSKLILPNGHYISAVDQNGAWRWMDQGTAADNAGKTGGNGSFSFPSWNDTFSYAPWDKTFQAPDGITEQNDPGYKDRMALGADAIQRSALAQGTGLTGGTLKDLEQFGQTFGSTEYGNVYGRALNDYNSALQSYQMNYNTAAQQYNQRYAQYGDAYNKAYQTYMGNFGVSNTLNQENWANYMGLASLGANAANNTNTAAGQYASGATGTVTGIGNANASGIVGGANATNTGLAGITNIATTTPFLYGQNTPYMTGTQSSYRPVGGQATGTPMTGQLGRPPQSFGPYNSYGAFQ